MASHRVRPGNHRLTIEIDAALAKRLRALAVERDTTVKGLTLEGWQAIGVDVSEAFRPKRFRIESVSAEMLSKW